MMIYLKIYLCASEGEQECTDIVDTVTGPSAAIGLRDVINDAAAVLAALADVTAALAKAAKI